ncbi:MAG: flagellar hook-basal body complex protein FliE [Pirellula sp.]
MQIPSQRNFNELTVGQHDTPTAKHADRISRLLQRVGEHAAADKAPNANPFSRLLVDGISQVNEMQNSAEGQMEQLLTGADVNQAEVFTSIQKADMSFRMLVQIRNKLLQAYEELNSIRV